MSGPNREQTQLAIAGNSPVIQYPPKTYARSLGQAERAVLTHMPALPQMPVRNRGHREASPRRELSDDDLSSDASQTLTPTSTNEAAQTPEDLQRVPTVQTTISQIIAAITPQCLKSLSDEELKEQERVYGYDQFKHELVNSFPKGFPRMAALINSNDSFLIYRKFGRMSSRLLLQLQIELEDLQAQFDELDKADAADPILEKRLRGFKLPESNTDQDEMRFKCYSKWMEYTAMLKRVAEIEELGQAPEKNHKAIFNWIWSRNPFGTERRSFITHADDFVSLVKHSHKERRVVNFIENYLDKRPTSWFRRFVQTKREIERTDDKYVDNYSSIRVEILADVFVVSLGTAILLLSVFLLFLVHMSRALMCVTASILVIVFTVAISTVTGAKSHEVLLGLAGISAVLFIFLGNMNQNVVGGLNQAGD